MDIVLIIAFYLGRLLLGGFFIYNAYGHFKNHQGLAGYAMSKGVPMAKQAVLLSGVMFLLGGLSIILGFKMVYGILILLVALIPITIMMHPFWKESDPQAKMMDRIQFTKNSAIIGALLIIVTMAYIYFV
jgi:putative oxidoreductase